MTTARLFFCHLRKTWLNYIDVVVSLFSLAEAAKRLKLQLAALIARGFPMQLPATAMSDLDSVYHNYRLFQAFVWAFQDCLVVQNKRAVFCEFPICDINHQMLKA